jgi:hypothetical protein
MMFTLLFACSKDEEESEELSRDPSISFVSLDPTEVENFNNSITLTIRYKDNNGDLGYEDPDVNSLYVKDARLDTADFYHVPPLAPVGKSLIIEGQLQIVLNSMFILGNGDQELAALSVKIQDRAGNWSNLITTPTITINR